MTNFLLFSYVRKACSRVITKENLCDKTDAVTHSVALNVDMVMLCNFTYYTFKIETKNLLIGALIRLICTIYNCINEGSPLMSPILMLS